ncbi:hypothetical protein HPB51_002981 [Rhipicephalus microplus]|uniref:Bovine pancreatic trypsin inhibitor n=1 Tax=Rhipicephalus microplus TaxID=6941 RepID=A0A9J6EEF0_RHIMP|nr:hypothetical protein HPB51_002981 [Rhipicephalus microplus]
MKFGTPFFSLKQKCNLCDFNNHCRNAVHQRTQMLYAKLPCTMPCLRLPLPTSQVCPAHLFLESRDNGKATCGAHPKEHRSVFTAEMLDIFTDPDHTEDRDVVQSWWWYLEGKGCRHWRFPHGHCPDGEDVFPTSLECVQRCVEAKRREAPCVTPKGVMCDVKHLRFGYIADASMHGSKARRCRQLPSSGNKAKLLHCLAGSNKFPTLEACQERCVPTKLYSPAPEQ